MDDFHFSAALMAARGCPWAHCSPGVCGDACTKACSGVMCAILTCFANLLVTPTAARRKWPYWILIAATTLALFALAGPAWERLEQPVYRTLNARAVGSGSVALHGWPRITSPPV